MLLQGKDLIIATKPFGKEKRLLSWYYTLSTLTLLIFLLFFSAIGRWLPARIASSILAGFVFIRFFVIYHDYQHKSILQKSIFAKGIMYLYGLYSLAPQSIWKRSHDYHHKHNSKLFSAFIGSYPIMTKHKFLNSTEKERKEYLASRHPLTVLFGFFSMFLIGMCVNSFRSNPKKHFDSLVAILIHVGVAALLVIYIGWGAWFLAWFLPFFIAFAIGAYLFYAQHNFPGVIFKNNEDWAYETAALESSSYLKMNRFMNWSTANIGYHHVHHLNSRIPFYRLPEAMKSLPELQHPKTTTFKPKDIAACFKLKFWDPEIQRMVGMDGLSNTELHSLGRVNS